MIYTMIQYILKGDKIEPCSDFDEWLEWMRHADHSIRKDIYDGARVSTIFLGLDHSFFPESIPVLFETMVFSDEADSESLRTWDQHQERYHTKHDAIIGHEEIFADLLAGTSCPH